MQFSDEKSSFAIKIDRPISEIDFNVLKQLITSKSTVDNDAALVQSLRDEIEQLRKENNELIKENARLFEEGTKRMKWIIQQMEHALSLSNRYFTNWSKVPSEEKLDK